MTFKFSFVSLNNYYYQILVIMNLTIHLDTVFSKDASVNSHEN